MATLFCLLRNVSFGAHRLHFDSFCRELRCVPFVKHDIQKMCCSKPPWFVITKCILGTDQIPREIGYDWLPTLGLTILRFETEEPLREEVQGFRG